MASALIAAYSLLASFGCEPSGPWPDDRPWFHGGPHLLNEPNQLIWDPIPIFHDGSGLVARIDLVNNSTIIVAEEIDPVRYSGKSSMLLSGNAPLPIRWEGVDYSVSPNEIVVLEVGLAPRRRSLSFPDSRSLYRTFQSRSNGGVPIEKTTDITSFLDLLKAQGFL